MCTIGKLDRRWLVNDLSETDLSQCCEEVVCNELIAFQLQFNEHLE